MVTVKFENSYTSATVQLGPYEWVQLTRDVLRVAPDGEEVAYLGARSGYWHVIEDFLGKDYTDVVIG